jgi:ubiquinone/menaquinone biosynthesis C-methylase UbiE
MDNNKPSRRSVFDGNFPKYYDFTAGALTFFQVRNIRKKAIDMLDLKEGDRALDIACGTGEFTEILADKVGSSGNVVGIDLSEKMIAVAQRKTKSMPQVTLSVHDFTSIPYKNMFDAATIGFAAHEVEGKTRQLMYKEAYQAIKKGGKFLAFDFVWPNILMKPFVWLFVMLVEPNGLDYLSESHEKVLQKIGFKKIDSYRWLFIDASVYQKT